MRPRRERNRENWFRWAFVLATILIVVLVLTSCPRTAGAQTFATTPQTVFVCGPLTFMLETTDVEVWGICEHEEFFYLVGYCNDTQRFDLSAAADEEMKASMSWYCSPAPGYSADIACELFPGWLHFRLLSKSNKLWDEFACPY